MQSYTEIPTGTKIKDSHDPLLNNDKTIMSCSSGTAFPTTNLQVGMLCYRTDSSQLFELFDVTPTWKLIADLSKTYLPKETADSTYFAKTGTLDQIQAPAANVSFNSKRITSLADPTGLFAQVSPCRPDELQRSWGEGESQVSFAQEAEFELQTRDQGVENRVEPCANNPRSDARRYLYLSGSCFGQFAQNLSDR